MTTTKTTINKQAVLDYLQRTETLPFYIANGDCRSENIKLVRFQNGVVEHEGKTYFPNWYGKKADKLPKEGLMYAYLVEKKFQSYTGSPIEKSANELLDILGGGKFPTFCPRDYCCVNEEFIPKISGINVYPVGQYRNGISLDYYQSGREGLVIQSLHLSSLEKFLECYIPSTCILTDEFKYCLVYTNGVAMERELNEVLDYRESKYSIDDSDEYEYSLSHLSLHQTYVDQINKIISKYFTAYKGEKYVK